MPRPYPPTVPTANTARQVAMPGKVCSSELSSVFPKRLPSNARQPPLPQWDAGRSIGAQKSCAAPRRKEIGFNPELQAGVRGAIGQGLTPDCYALDLEQALSAVGEIIGSVDHEKILDSVFSQFCIGK